MSCDRVKIFISHDSEERGLASAIKSSLFERGFDTFVAHDDIIPTKTWSEELIKSLDESNIIVVLVSELSNASAWVQQEVGYSVAKGKYIIPVKINADPKGFLASIQALKLPMEINEYGRKFYLTSHCAIEIGKLLLADVRYKDNLINQIIDKIQSSQSFVETEGYVFWFDYFNEITKEQANLLLDVAISNGQVNHAYCAKKAYRSFISKNRAIMDEDKISLLQRLFPD